MGEQSDHDLLVSLHERVVQLQRAVSRMEKHIARCAECDYREVRRRLVGNGGVGMVWKLYMLCIASLTAGLVALGLKAYELMRVIGALR